jgi:hypothetical protein
MLSVFVTINLAFLDKKNIYTKQSLSRELQKDIDLERTRTTKSGYLEE